MTRYFMRDTPLRYLEQEMMTPPHFAKMEVTAYTAETFIIAHTMWNANFASALPTNPAARWIAVRSTSRQPFLERCPSKPMAALARAVSQDD